MPKILCFGAILWDVVGGDYHLGGAPLNVAADLAAFGWQAAILTRVGKDRLGEEALRALEKLGVSAAYVQRDPVNPTGTATVTLSGKGIPQYTFLDNAAYNDIDLDEDLLGRISDEAFDVFCFGTYEQRTVGNRKVLYSLLEKTRFSTIFFDVNIRAGFCPEEVFEKSLRHAGIVKMNEDEARYLSRLVGLSGASIEAFAAKLLRDYPLRAVCVTMGENGCYVCDRSGSMVLPPVEADIADTIGAGDAYSAAFIHNYYHHQNPFSAGRAGNILGAYTASCAGAIPAFTRQIVNRINGIRPDISEGTHSIS